MKENTMLEKARDIAPTLFQILDGLWFIQVEKVFGFDKAMEIDRAVWEIYSRKEGERLMRATGKTPGQGTLEDLRQLLPLSMFNQTLCFKTELQRDGKNLVFLVTACKTKEGMERVGRSNEQIFTICKEIGLMFFSSFAQAIHPDIKVKCLFCPLMAKSEKCDPNNLEEKGGLCGWQFFF